MRLISLFLILACMPLFGESMHAKDWLHLGAHLLGPPAMVSIQTPAISVQAGHHYCNIQANHYRPQPIVIQHYPLRSRLVCIPVAYEQRPAPVICIEPVQYHPPEPSPIRILRHTVVARGSPPPEHRITILVDGNLRSYQIE